MPSTRSGGKPVDLTTPCIEWTGGHSEGYGALHVGGKVVRAHRWVWEQAHGPIPPGVMVLHVCNNRPCVNLAHLRLGGGSANQFDSVAAGTHVAARKTHCPRNHPYDGTWANGKRRYRYCLQCERERGRRNRAAKRAA